MKKLYKSNTNKMLTGVCGGFAEYLGLDPTIVRLIYAIATLITLGGLGIIVYIVCAVVIPADDGII